jgi:hypothetical protein
MKKMLMLLFLTFALFTQEAKAEGEMTGKIIAQSTCLHKLAPYHCMLLAIGKRRVIVLDKKLAGDKRLVIAVYDLFRGGLRIEARLIFEYGVKI